jgi:hypothetical protein
MRPMTWDDWVAIALFLGLMVLVFTSGMDTSQVNVRYGGR